MCTHGNTHLADGMVAGHGYRVPQAQRPLRRHDRRTPSPARRASPCAPTSCGKVTAASCSTSRHRRRASLLDTTLTFEWCQQSERRDVHQGTGARASHGQRPGRRSALDSTSSCRFQPTATSRSATSTSGSPTRQCGRRTHLLRPGRQQRPGAQAQLLACHQPGLDVRASCASTCGSPRRRRGQDCGAGAGSSWCLALEARRHRVTASGPFGDFLIPDGDARWSTSAAAPAWRRSARIFSYLFETAADHPQGLLLVRRALAAGGLLRRRTSAISKRGFRTSASTSRSRRRWQTTSGLARPGSSTTCCAANSCYSTPIPSAADYRLRPAGDGQSHPRHAAARIRRGAAGHRGG